MTSKRYIRVFYTPIAHGQKLPHEKSHEDAYDAAVEYCEAEGLDPDDAYIDIERDEDNVFEDYMERGIDY